MEPRRTPRIKITRSLLEVILDKCCSRIEFWSKFVVSFFRPIFQIAFGNPPTRISEDFEVILKFSPFPDFDPKLQNCKDATPLTRNACF